MRIFPEVPRLRRIVCWVLLGWVTVQPRVSLGKESPLAVPAFELAPAFALKSEPHRKRGFIIPPLVSFLLPGFDQWWEGQYGYAAAYTSAAVVGTTYSFATVGLTDPRPTELGAQLCMAAGGYSLYHSFRTAVDSRRSSGEFAFLKHEESPSDVLLAPFQVSYMARMTTMIPLALAAGLAFVEPYQAGRAGLNAQTFTFNDAYFDTTRSYLAGTWEESAFRGYLMPVAMFYTDSELASNVMTAAVFGAAHTQPGFIPWPQFVMGLYLGYLTQKNEWRIGESIFVHSWWDLFLMLGESLATHNGLSLRLPTFSWYF